MTVQEAREMIAQLEGLGADPRQFLRRDISPDNKLKRGPRFKEPQS